MSQADSDFPSSTPSRRTILGGLGLTAAMAASGTAFAQAGATNRPVAPPTRARDPPPGGKRGRSYPVAGRPATNFPFPWNAKGRLTLVNLPFVSFLTIRPPTSRVGSSRSRGARSST